MVSAVVRGDGKAKGAGRGEGNAEVDVDNDDIPEFPPLLLDEIFNVADDDDDTNADDNEDNWAADDNKYDPRSLEKLVEKKSWELKQKKLCNNIYYINKQYLLY